MEEIIAVDRNNQGEIISFKTSSGRVISYRKAIQEIEQGLISGVTITEDSNEGIPIIHTINASDEDFENFPPIY